MQTLSAPPESLNATSRTLRSARSLELRDGEVVSGIVCRLPAHGQPFGNRVFLRSQDELVSLDASAKRGSTVLARELVARNITVGTEVTIAYRGWRESRAGHRYRQFEVQVSP